MADDVARLNAALEGRYRVERELGVGGMATVYLADDLRHERQVAIKVLKPELAAVIGAIRQNTRADYTANVGRDGRRLDPGVLHRRAAAATPPTSDPVEFKSPAGPS